MGVTSYSNLWLASDHLMVVRSSGFSEGYTRIQLSNIKAIFLVVSERRKWWALPWAIVATWSGIVVILSLANRVTPTVSVCFLIPSLVLLVWNHLLGVGCSAYVVTGVQTALLPSLVRMKKARKVLARLEPLVAAAQADLVVATPAVEQPATAAQPEPAAAIVMEPAVSAPEPTTPTSAAPVAVAPAEPAGDAAPNPPATG